MILLLSETASYRFTLASQEPLQKLSEWASLFGMKFSWSKCGYIIFPYKGQIGRRPPIKLEGQPVKVFDVKLTWMAHLNRVLEKVTKFENKIKQFVRATWGLRPNVLKEVYLRATERYALYGAENWYRDTVRIKNKLAQIQRKALISVTKCYRTVSTVALQVLAGCEPLDIRADFEQKKYGIMHGNMTHQIGELILDANNCYQVSR